MCQKMKAAFLPKLTDLLFVTCREKSFVVLLFWKQWGRRGRVARPVASLLSLPLHRFLPFVLFRGPPTSKGETASQAGQSLLKPLRGSPGKEE